MSQDDLKNIVSVSSEDIDTNKPTIKTGLFQLKKDISSASTSSYVGLAFNKWKVHKDERLIDEEDEKHESKRTILEQNTKKTIENKVKKNSSPYETCKVCSKNSDKIIFAYNMQICQACKKFYQRAIDKSEGKQYVDGKVQICNELKKTLNEQLDHYKCKKSSGSPLNQYVRLKKCIEIKMETENQIETAKFEMVCRICPNQKESTGIHYGIATCDACKVFFRRYSEKNNLVCLNDGNCDNNCSACRFKKMLALGMDRENSKVGRQANLDKHKLKNMNFEDDENKIVKPISDADKLYEKMKTEFDRLNLNEEAHRKWREILPVVVEMENAAESNRPGLEQQENQLIEELVTILIYSKQEECWNTILFLLSIYKKLGHKIKKIL